ncbi:MAG: FAD-dependent oxidoreductase, partial [Chloroflexota bacterium]|nr:FAD-dependent oxidoreductase [Chloroflexota bacterium]
MLTQEKKINVGGIILAPRYQIYQAELSQEFGFGRYPNVITALQFERLLSASGPTMGQIQRPSDDQTPQRIAFLQCIGSRDQNHDYCSAVCCMYATKEAVMAKEHHPELDIHVFQMDMRAFSKGYLGYFERARDKYGIHYHYSRISNLYEDTQTHSLILNYTEDKNPHQIISDAFDLVVLSVGMEISDSVQALGRQLGVELDEYGFCRTVQFNPVETSRAGIYAVGPFREPKDIPESVMEASVAAGAVGTHLGEARFSLTTTPEFPPERDVSGEEPRIGIFVCHCGTNIGGYLDVPQVTEYAATLPNVVHAEDNLYTCSQDSVKHITEMVKEENLNRVIVASCTPLTHQPLFQDSIRAAGLNPYLFEMANIRNQCSWVHSDDWDKATTKAKGLVRMAVAKSALLEAQTTIDVPVNNAALVVGGGAAGMVAALTLAESGFPVHLVEKEAELGGNLRHVYTSHDGRKPQYILRQLVERVHSTNMITVHTESQVKNTTGFKGNFITTLDSGNGSREKFSHGATILATGAQEYRGPEYGYGSDARIVTQLEFEEMMAGEQGSWGARERGSKGAGDDEYDENQSTNLPSSVVMIQCVGPPAEQYCSRICCTVALKNALTLKEYK